MEKAEEFLIHDRKIKNPSKYEVAVVVILLYHTFGHKNVANEIRRCSADSEVYKILGDEGMVLYKLIFDNNSNSLVRKFFQSEIIRKLWASIIKDGYLTFDICFMKTENGVKTETKTVSNVKTYSAITK